jgi:hypothetical protein
MISTVGEATSPVGKSLHQPARGRRFKGGCAFFLPLYPWQLRMRIVSSTVPIIEMMIDPRQPLREEKNANMRSAGPAYRGDCMSLGGCAPRNRLMSLPANAIATKRKIQRNIIVG